MPERAQGRSRSVTPLVHAAPESMLTPHRLSDFRFNGAQYVVISRE